MAFDSSLEFQEMLIWHEASHVCWETREFEDLSDSLCLKKKKETLHLFKASSRSDSTKEEIGDLFPHLENNHFYYD